jgi:hypothetical protein
VPGLSLEQLEVLQTFIADLTEESGDGTRTDADAAAGAGPEDAPAA